MVPVATTPPGSPGSSVPGPAKPPGLVHIDLHDLRDLPRIHIARRQLIDDVVEAVGQGGLEILKRGEFQTWLAGKSPMNGGFHRKITYKW